MRIVLDTNAWLDLFVFEDPAAAALAAALRSGALRALRSHRTDEELRAVSIRPQFASRLAIRPLEPMLEAWRNRAEPIEPDRTAPWICSDPDDQKFLDLAVAGGAGMLFTKDRALLRLARAARKSGLAILTPETYRSRIDPATP